MTDHDLSSKILETIKEKDMHPKAKWLFTVRDIGVWLGGLVFLITGGLAMAVIIHIVRFNDWDVHEHIAGNVLSFFFISLPYIWLMLFGLIIWTFYQNIRHTKKGYQHTLVTILVVGFVGSLFLGLVFYGLGMGQKLNTLFSEKVPHYNTFLDKRPYTWSHPEEGRLAGVIIRIHSQEAFDLVDMDKLSWTVFRHQGTDLGPISPAEGHKVRIIGQQTAPQQFIADQILPWLPSGKKELEQGSKSERKFYQLRIRQQKPAVDEQQNSGPQENKSLQ